MSEKQTIPRKSTMESLALQEERILTILREERKRTREKFPLAYALVGTFGLLCTVGGLNKIIDGIDFLNTNPIILVVFGLAILLITGAAYKKL